MNVHRLSPGRRSGLSAALLACAASFVLMPISASAQENVADYPSRAIRFIVPYAPGGLPDTVARIVGQQITESTGRSVVVENKPGANGVIAAQTLLGSPADGYTFLVTDGSMMSINPYLYKDLAYDHKRDFIPVSLVATSPLFLAAREGLPVNSLDEFIKLAKNSASKPITYGSSGVGSSHHLTMEAFRVALNLPVSHVPFRGSGQSVPALVGNQVDVVISAYPSLAGFQEKGQAKILATNSLERSALAPKVPAMSEVVPGFNFAVTVGVLAPKGTPQALVDKLSKEIATGIKTKAVADRMLGLGIEPVGGTPQDYAKAIDEETKRYESAIKAAGIQAN